MTADNKSSTIDQYQRRWLALFGLGLALVLLNLDLTVVNLALPILGQQFHASLSTLQWVNNIYSLTFAALVALTGKVADRYGHRRMYLVGVIFFLLGSLVAGVAANMSLLIVGRFLQGVGMAGTFGMVFILASAAFPEKQRPMAVGLLVVFVGVAQAVGPTVGGFIIEHWGWRWAFLINLPFCVLSYLFVAFACQKDKLRPENTIHYASAVLFLIAYFILVAACNQIQIWGLDSVLFIGSFSIGLIIFILALYWQKKLATPFFDLNLFKNKVYRTVSHIRPLFQFNFGAFFFILPLYLQNMLGMTASMTGLVMLIMTAPLAISSLIAGKLNGRLSPEKPLIFAHVVAIIGFVIFACMPISPIHWAWFSLGLVCIGVNVGVMYSTTNYLAINSLPADKKGVGYGFFTANAYFFYSIGIGIAGYLLTTISAAHLTQLLSHTSLADQFTNLKSYADGARPIQHLLSVTPAHAPLLLNAALQSFAKGFSAIMWLFAALSVLGFIILISSKESDSKAQ